MDSDSIFIRATSLVHKSFGRILSGTPFPPIFSVIIRCSSHFRENWLFFHFPNWIYIFLHLNFFLLFYPQIYKIQNEYHVIHPYHPFGQLAPSHPCHLSWKPIQFPSRAFFPGAWKWKEVFFRWARILSSNDPIYFTHYPYLLSAMEWVCWIPPWAVGNVQLVKWERAEWNANRLLLSGMRRWFPQSRWLMRPARQTRQMISCKRQRNHRHPRQ